MAGFRVTTEDPSYSLAQHPVSSPQLLPSNPGTGVPMCSTERNQLHLHGHPATSALFSGELVLKQQKATDFARGMSGDLNSKPGRYRFEVSGSTTMAFGMSRELASVSASPQPTTKRRRCGCFVSRLLRVRFPCFISCGCGRRHTGQSRPTTAPADQTIHSGAPRLSRSSLNCRLTCSFKLRISTMLKFGSMLASVRRTCGATLSAVPVTCNSMGAIYSDSTSLL